MGLFFGVMLGVAELLSQCGDFARMIVAPAIEKRVARKAVDEGDLVSGHQEIAQGHRNFRDEAGLHQNNVEDPPAYWRSDFGWHDLRFASNSGQSTQAAPASAPSSWS